MRTKEISALKRDMKNASVPLQTNLIQHERYQRYFLISSSAGAPTEKIIKINDH